MHEMSIAVELMGPLEALAKQHGLLRIREITVRAGVLRGIVPEALEWAFAEVARGTPAQGATLKLDIAPARACCRVCGEEFSPTVDSFLCPQCRQADVDIFEGNEILLLSIDGDSADEN